MLSVCCQCLLLAMCLTLGQTLESYRAEDGYEVFPAWPGSRYKLGILRLTWAEALTACQGDGGESHLVIINSQAEAEVVRKLFARITDPKAKYLSIGMDDIVTEGIWLTIQGTLVSTSGYNTWHAREPNSSGGNEDCGCVYKDGSLNDCYCGWFMPFVCEKPNV